MVWMGKRKSYIFSRKICSKPVVFSLLIVVTGIPTPNLKNKYSRKFSNFKNDFRGTTDEHECSAFQYTPALVFNGHTTKTTYFIMNISFNTFQKILRKWGPSGEQSSKKNLWKIRKTSKFIEKKTCLVNQLYKGTRKMSST